MTTFYDNLLITKGVFEETKNNNFQIISYNLDINLINYMNLINIVDIYNRYIYKIIDIYNNKVDVLYPF